MNRIFPKNTAKTRASKLESITLPGFGGGLNAIDSDISMQPQYCVALDNFRRATAAGSQRLRPGSRWFADVNTIVSGNIIDVEYFSGSIIAVTESGQVVAVDDNGNKVAIWNSTIAAALPGTPAGWSIGLDSIDFVPYKNTLVIHNGIDKPIAIDASLTVTYLQDLASGSNVNVPIGKYGCVASNYHCVAGIDAVPTTIYISALGTVGTFPGDPAPNDAISIDVGAYAPKGAPEIRGIAGFRSNLIVFFASQALIVELGTYNDAGIHVPKFPDTLPSFGLLGHRCIAQVINDLLFAGFGSMNSAKRNLFGLVGGDTLSDIVEPAFRVAIGALTDDQRLKNCFMIHDNVLHDTVLYMPEGKAVVYSANDKLRYKSWSTYTNPAWTCGCVSFLGRVFLVVGSRIFLQGNRIFAGEDYTADRLGDRDGNWAPGHSYFVNDIAYDTVDHVSYICIADHISGGVTFAQDRAIQIFSSKWELYEGEAIPFEMELPWISGKDAMKTKQTRYASVATVGTADFTLRVWVDNLYKDNDGTVRFDPALSMVFKGNDAIGFGYDAGPYGGGRRSSDPRLFSFPVAFKTIKIGIVGSTKEPLEIAGISFLFSRGRYRRA